jgi:hypothetical protein
MEEGRLHDNYLKSKYAGPRAGGTHIGDVMTTCSKIAIKANRCTLYHFLETTLMLRK